MIEISEEALRQIASCERKPIDDESATLLLDCYESYKRTFTPDVISACSGQWVAAFHGKIVATERDQDDIFEELERQAIPRGFTAVRFIDS